MTEYSVGFAGAFLGSCWSFCPKSLPTCLVAAQPHEAQSSVFFLESHGTRGHWVIPILSPQPCLVGLL